MSDYSNKYGTLNPFELRKNIQQKQLLTEEYKKINNLSDFKEFLNHDKDMVKEIMYGNSVPKNAEIINYLFVEDKCFYNDKIIKDIVVYGIQNNDLKLLETVKNRHPEFLKIKPQDISQTSEETLQFFIDNTDKINNLSEFEKTIISTHLISEKQYNKIDLLNLKEHIIENPKPLTLDSMKDFIDKYELSNPELKSYLSQTFMKKGDCGDEDINVFIDNNDFSLEEVQNEKGGYGDNLLNEKIQYLNNTYSFDNITLQEAFDKSIDNHNLECAKTLLETNKFKPKVSTLIKIEKQFPEFHNYCKKSMMKQDLDNKLTYKEKTQDISHGLKI